MRKALRDDPSPNSTVAGGHGIHRRDVDDDPLGRGASGEAVARRCGERRAARAVWRTKPFGRHPRGSGIARRPVGGSRGSSRWRICAPYGKWTSRAGRPRRRSSPAALPSRGRRPSPPVASGRPGTSADTGPKRSPAGLLEQPEDVAVRVPDLRVVAVGKFFGLLLEFHPLRL